MKLNGPQTKDLCDALSSAFPRRASLTQMVLFGLNENLESIADGETLNDVIFNLVAWAKAQGKADELVIRARENNPGNPELAAITRVLFPNPPSDPLPPKEVAVGQDIRRNWVDFEVFARIQTLARTVCRIELREGYGTGFLIGPDLLLTCQHVVSELLPTPSRISNSGATLRFDFRIQSDGTSSKGRTCRLASDWLMATSPADELNFALVRLNDSPGNDLMTNAEPRAIRGWVPIADSVEAALGDALVIVGHPYAAPLSIILATQHSLGERESLLYESTRTPGLSGEPCFSRNMEFVAMHAGECNSQKFNLSELRIKRALLGRAIVSQSDVRAILKNV